MLGEDIEQKTLYRWTVKADSGSLWTVEASANTDPGKGITLTLSSEQDEKHKTLPSDTQDKNVHPVRSLYLIVMQSFHVNFYIRI